MKIGILTFQLVRNYGALLQCYALQEVLKCFSKDVCVIDYRQKNINQRNKFNYKLIISYLVRFRPLAAYYTFLGQRKKIYETRVYRMFVKRYLNLTKACNSKNIPYCNKYILGSDQIWSIACTDGEIDETYFGEFLHNNSLLIGYAISTNIKSINVIGENRLNRYISNFSSISFREANIAEFISAMMNKKFDVVLDPTLLASRKIYTRLLNNKWKNKQYIVTYNLRGKINEINNEAKKVSEKYGYDIIDISFAKYSVSDFVSLIKDAKIVITSSFHGTVFSIIFHKPLYSIVLNDGHDSRSVDLLISLGMKDNLFNVNFSESNLPNVDWDDVERKIQNKRSESMNFLYKSI